MPEFVKRYEKYNGMVEMYAANITYSDNEGNVKKFVQHFGMIFPVLLDDGKNASVANLYRIPGLTSTFFVDKNGMIVDKIIGAADPQNLKNEFLAAQ